MLSPGVGCIKWAKPRGSGAPRVHVPPPTFCRMVHEFASFKMACVCHVRGASTGGLNAMPPF
jgi:hypothetical protein